MNTISDEAVKAARVARHEVLKLPTRRRTNDDAMRAAIAAANAVTEREQAEQQKSATGALFDPSRLPARDEDGRVTHPDYSIVVTTDLVFGTFFNTQNTPSAPHPPAQVPEGWKLVPIEPTLEMLFAMQRSRYGYEKGDSCGQGSALAYFDQSIHPHLIEPAQACRHEYRAMLAAAPTPPSADQEQAK